VTRCQNFARDWGYGGLVVTNIFALRATDPKDMLAHPDPVGPENDNIIVSQAMHAKVVVCAWGEDGKHLGWAASVVALLRRYSIPLYCLQRNQSGEPSHPLYLRKDLKPIPWT
jgi:hypothetical protein